METFSALLGLCAGNSPVTGEFPAQTPVTRSFDVFFGLRLNKRLSKQSSGWRFETPSRSLWRQRNVLNWWIAYGPSNVFVVFLKKNCPCIVLVTYKNICHQLSHIWSFAIDCWGAESSLSSLTKSLDCDIKCPTSVNFKLTQWQTLFSYISVPQPLRHGELIKFHRCLMTMHGKTFVSCDF